MQAFHRLLAVGALSAAAAACGDRSPIAYGDPNSIIVIAPDTLWQQVSAEVHEALEPTIFAVRDERTFTITHVAPSNPDWRTLREWRQVLAIGQPSDAWVEPVLAEADAATVPAEAELPALVEAQGVWARAQLATAVLLPPGGGQEEIRRLLPELHDLLDRRFRAYARQRMFASGVDSALAQRLAREAGFTLYLPQVYRWSTRDGVYVFLNDQPDPSKLLRSVLVAWREGVPEALTVEGVLQWRAELAREFYDPPQETDLERLESRVLEEYAGPALEVQGVWSALGSWPAAGPFINRMIVCPEQNRTYLLDAHLYAPSRDKYEYMLQLRAILDSFECGGA